MGFWTAALLAASLNAAPAVIEKDGVRIEASVRAHIYTWTVTNIDAPPIVSFECGPKNTYNPHGPEGWEIEESNSRYYAWTDSTHKAIRPERFGAFDARVSSSGAVLGTVSATIGFGPDHEPLVFEEIWGPVAKPRASKWPNSPATRSTKPPTA